MRANGLIDTSAIVALLDRTDRWHPRCVKAFAQLRLPFATSEAVLAEVFHLLGENQHDYAWKFLRSGAIVMASIEDSELTDIRTLMSRYADRPMDFADATLVHLANREKLANVFTIDHADFSTYRMEGRRRFRIVPESRP